MREKFITYVCGLLAGMHDGDQALADIVSSRLRAVPAAFWYAPASSSGKYHPDYALGDGGLVRHTLVVITLVRDLARAYGLTSKTELAILTVAAAFHDTYKGGDTGEAPWTETVKDHPTLAARALRSRELAYGKTDFNLWDVASYAVGTHMSMWGPRKPLPITQMNGYCACLSSADYLASRPYLQPTRELAELLGEFGWSEPHA